MSRHRLLLPIALAGAGLVSSSAAVRAQPTTGGSVSPKSTIGAPSSAAASSSTLLAAAAAAPSSSVGVNEDPPPALSKPAKSVAGWQGLWKELGKGSIDLRIALAEIERAEAATRIARGGVYPTATGLVTLTHVPDTGSITVGTRSGDTLSAQLNVGATLINLRGFHAIGTAKAGEEIAALSILDVRRRLGLNLARAVVSIASAARLAELNRIGVETALERLLLTRKRLAAGVGDNRDLVRAQQDLATARAAIAPADEALRQAREGLAVVLGESGELGVSGDSDALEKEMLGFCGDTNKGAERVDVLIAKKQIDIAKRNVDDITLKFVPTLTASLNIGAIGPAFAGPYAGGWSISGVLTIPLYDGGIRYGEKRDREALVEEARARAVQIEIGTIVERDQARRAIDVAVSARTSAKEARDLAHEADRLARVAYAAGIGTNFDLIDAGRRLREAETTLVLRDLDVARARISLPFIEGRCAGVTA